MVSVKFVQPDGAEHIISANPNETVMVAATRNKVAGIIGECGGNLSCATCHVFVDPAWVGKLKPKAAEEDEMLENTFEEQRANSRLGCQIRLTPDLDGIVFHVPAAQR